MKKKNEINKRTNKTIKIPVNSYGCELIKLSHRKVHILSHYSK